MTDSSEPIRVLHVDDDPEFVDLTADVLEHENDRFTVETALDVSDGLDSLADGGFDCIVADYDMPGQDGLEFLETVRDEHPDLPFILFTGEGGEAVASEAISAGVTDYLRKEQGTEQYTLLANRIVNAVERARVERSERRHLEAIETAKEGISILDEDGVFLYVNESFADLYGYEQEEMIGEHWRLVYPEENVDRIHEDIAPALEEDGEWSGETTGLRADGSRFVEDHRIATTDRGELVCTVRDVTERRRHRRAIEDLHDTARACMGAETPEDVAAQVVEAARDILDMRANGVHLYDEAEHALVPAEWTEQAEELADEIPTFEPGEGLAWDVFETADAQLYDDLSATAERYNPETDVRSELVLPLGDHGVLLVGSSEPGAFDETDVSLARTLAAHATTALDRIDRERELREERALTEAIFEALPDVVCAFDSRGRFLRWSASVPEITGYSDAEIESMRAMDFFEGEDLDRIEDAIQRVLAGEGPTTVEADVVTKSGETIRYEFTGAPLPDESGDTTGFVASGRDVTEREQRERALRMRNERLEEFASIVSHDLRNPLNVAQARLELTQDECESPHLADIENALERMEALIEELLTLAREGETATATEPVAIAETVEACWRTVETAEAILDVETDRTIRADRGRLQQMFENLVRNAVEHGGDDVTVTVGDLDGGFYVADDGPGIPVAERDVVFEPGHSTVEEGIGFGLTIVETVADAHGWSVDVTESDSGGARFEITGVDVVEG